MVKKFALNFLYNIGVIFCIATVYWGYQHKQYIYMVVPVFIAALLIIFKLRLLKEIKNAQKNQ
jgi:purine-cytosine permease-like protein